MLFLPKIQIKTLIISDDELDNAIRCGVFDIEAGTLDKLPEKECTPAIDSTLDEISFDMQHDIEYDSESSFEIPCGQRRFSNGIDSAIIVSDDSDEEYFEKVIIFSNFYYLVFL